MPELRTDYHVRRGLVALLVILVATGASVYSLYTPPPPKPIDAPDTSFSASRAMEIVEATAQEPHPVGSPENVRVRDYLLARIEALGLEPHLDDELLFSPGAGGVGNAQSIYARIKGTDSSGAIMLTGHYDSVAYGPGAADDCSGVATVLESARAILAGEPLRNDIILHLSDGEEGGLLGAKSFMEHGPWREDLALVINFEARGHHGPSLMFQTSDRNGRLVREYIEAAPYPVASSVMFDIARLMPTTTDYWVYKAAGVPGYDFAFVGGLKYYHTINDSPEYLSRATLQGHGENCLALARHLGNRDLIDLHDDNLVYFNTFGHDMVHYPATWVWPLTFLALVLFFITLVMGFTRGVLQFGTLGSGILWYLLALLLVPLVVVVPIGLGLRAFGPYALYNQPYYVVGFVLLTLTVFLTVYALASRRVRLEGLWAGALVVLGVLMFVQTRLLPLGGYLFLWPFLFSTIGLLLSILTAQRPWPWLRLFLVLTSIVPACVLMAPQLPIIFDTATLIIGPVAMFVGAQLLGHLIPVLCHVVAPERRLAPAMTLALAVPFLVWGIYNTTFDASRPKMNFLAYGMNLDTQDACWVSKNDQEDLDVWLENFYQNGGVQGDFAEYDIGSTEQYLRTAAPMADLQEAQIDIVSNDVKGARRHITYHVRPAHATAGFNLFTPGRVVVYEGKVNGVKIGRNKHRPLASWFIHYKGRCDEGILVELVVDTQEDDPALTLVEYSFGLPTINGDPVPPRPDWMIPQTNTMPYYDLSREALQTRDPDEIFRFAPRNINTRRYVRQTFHFPQTSAAETAQAGNRS